MKQQEAIQQTKLAALADGLNLNSIAVLALMLFASVQMSAGESRRVEHPGSINANDDCSVCHADKSRGKSVHSAMALPCTVCHVAESQGDMTTLILFMPKPKVCFACHEQSKSVAQHKTKANERCLNCHEAHSSNQPNLLRELTSLPER
jgi:predicted CXXCH cytochrome family protein